MERDYNSEDFEFFLKQKANQHKLYPSERVWKKINSALHPGRKWFTWAGSLLIITGLFMISKDSLFQGPSHTSTTKIPAITTLQPITAPGEFKPVRHMDINITAGSQNASNEKVWLPVASSNNPEAVVINFYKETAVPARFNISAPALYPGEKNIETIIQAGNENAVVQEEHKELVDDLVPGTGIESQNRKEINWLQEMAVIKLSVRKSSPFNLQLYFSPTISYRSLTENDKNSHTGSPVIPLSNAQPKIDRFVDHKPALGVELGSNILFNVSKSFILKTGLQLNYSRYNIKAYKYYYEKASIALNSAGAIPDTITAYTSFRNFNGYTPEQLQNQYLQVSMPIGAELKLFGTDELQLNVAGTIQPSYLLYNDTYLLSTDYLNYAKEPSLIRKWNVNTSFEAFISYKTGDFRWQLGPQFRYQLLSSFNDRYPISEYLMEYGVKFGVSKMLK